MKIDPGSICGLIGRNGTGKSTLMKLGVGELKPFSGNIFIHGVCVTTLSPVKRFQHIAYLSQNTFLPRELRVADCLKKCHADKLLFTDEIVKPLLSEKIGILSGGERRYLEILLVLSLKRFIYLLDEPFTGASPKLIERMIAFLRKKKEDGAGLLITDHYTRYVEEIVDKTYELRDGYCMKK